MKPGNEAYIFCLILAVLRGLSGISILWYGEYTVYKRNNPFRKPDISVWRGQPAKIMGWLWCISSLLVIVFSLTGLAWQSPDRPGIVFLMVVLFFSFEFLGYSKAYHLNQRQTMFNLYLVRAARG